MKPGLEVVVLVQFILSLCRISKPRPQRVEAPDRGQKQDHRSVPILVEHSGLG